MKLLITFLAALFLVTSAGNSYPVKQVYADEEVYICVSGNAKVYHRIRECHGLSPCTHTIKKVKESEAIRDYNRRACKVCYK
jgi:hypothetical protein